METKDRIRQIMEDKHMTQQVFADFLQQSPATLSSIFNGRTRPTINVIEAIKAKIPDISTEWLLFGSGDMYITHPAESSASDMETHSRSSEPMLNFDTSLPETSQIRQSDSQARTYQHGVISTRPEIVREEIKIIDKEPRKVTEIRVYYDDQTYETFVPAKK